MKTKIAILLTLFAFHSNQALAGDPRNSVISYECDEVNQLVDEFECRQKQNGMELHWNVETTSLSEERKKEVLYHFNRIGLRYVQLGGRNFDVTADFYPDNRYSACTATSDHRSFRCSLMECKQLNGGRQCGEVQ